MPNRSALMIIKALQVAAYLVVCLIAVVVTVHVIAAAYVVSRYTEVQQPIRGSAQLVAAVYPVTDRVYPHLVPDANGCVFMSSPSWSFSRGWGGYAWRSLHGHPDDGRWVSAPNAFYQSLWHFPMADAFVILLFVPFLLAIMSWLASVPREPIRLQTLLRTMCWSAFAIIPLAVFVALAYVPIVSFWEYISFYTFANGRGYALLPSPEWIRWAVGGGLGLVYLAASFLLTRRYFLVLHTSDRARLSSDELVPESRAVCSKCGYDSAGISGVCPECAADLGGGSAMSGRMFGSRFGGCGVFRAVVMKHPCISSMVLGLLVVASLPAIAGMINFVIF